MTNENLLSIPDVCHCCNSKNVVCTTNDKIYGKAIGKWTKVYLCLDCRAYVGCHEGTENALGRLANTKTRRLRKQAHEVFDKLWRKGYLSRSDAYNRLADFLSIEYDDCHISWMTDIQLKITARWSELFILENPPSVRRQVKKNAKQLEQLKRESKQREVRKTNRKSRFSRSR